VSLERRLAKVEASVTPTQSVLRWLDEAQSHGTMAAYLETLFSGSLMPTPMDTVTHAATAGARDSAKGQPKETIEKAATLAARQAVFRFLLVLRLNEGTAEEARFRTMMGLCLFFWMRALDSDQSVREMLAAESAQAGRPGGTWERWQEAAIGLLATIYAEEEARLILERDYLDGHPSLFPDVEASWAEAREMAERVARMAVFLDRVTDDEPPQSLAEVDLRPHRAGVAETAAKRASYLADIARAKTLDLSHEEHRALQIMARHFGGGDAGDPAA
jgi:hypothetical protein